MLDRQCSAHYNFLQVSKNSWSGNYSCPWFRLLDLMVCQFELYFGGRYGIKATHAAIAKPKSVPVKDFMEWVGFSKVVIYEWKEVFTDFGFYILTVYQAEVVTPQSKETYIGLCDTTFKERYRNHTCSFRNERYKNVTELSKYIWSLKDRRRVHPLLKKILYPPLEIKRRKERQARSYSHINKKCNLCLREKFFIICKPEMSTLNHRNGLTSICRHSKKFLLNTVLS